MIHQPWGGCRARRATSASRSSSSFKLKNRLNEDPRAPHRQAFEQVETDADRDYYMTAEEAKAYGLVDEVVASRKEIKEARRRRSSGMARPKQPHDVQLSAERRTPKSAS
jgi:ATP-dependent Clp protease protease subunit